MALTKAQQAAREGKLTASAVGALMSGDETKIMNLWRRLVGDPAYQDDDLSGIWAINLGEATEELNLDWYERKHRKEVTKRGEVISHAGSSWAACTLDGWVEADFCPIECKHVGGREPFERIVNRYMPQMQWQMAITGAQRCILSVIEGASEPRYEIVNRDQAYIDEMWERARRFMQCVENMVPPVDEGEFASPARPTREVDMTGNNEWGHYASLWLENNDAAGKAKTSEINLKGIMPIDAQRAFGHGVDITRDRAGRLSLRETA
jgi:predicted phage-related endonuclease